MANWKAVAKHGAITAGEVGVLATSMIVTKKFLDARVIFAKQIAADPAYAEKWYIKHQGALKLGAGVIAATMIKNPWLKMVCIGVALEGFVTEARVLTTNKDGVSLFDSIGADSSIDQEMIDAAKATQGNAGRDFTEGTSGFGDRFQSTVGANFGDRFMTTVGFNDLDNDRISQTAGYWGAP